MLQQFVATPIDDVVALRSNAVGNSLNAGQLTISVIFAEEKGVLEALEKAEMAGPYVAADFGEVECVPFLQSYCEAYKSSIIPVERLQQNVEEYMAEYDKKQLEAKKWRKRRQEADEDGWITVKKGSRKSVPDAKKLKQGEKAETKRKAKKRKIEEEIPFYTSQIKESKVKHLNELRAKFEEDKKRVAMAKAARKFRPV